MPIIPCVTECFAVFEYEASGETERRRVHAWETFDNLAGTHTCYGLVAGAAEKSSIDGRPLNGSLKRAHEIAGFKGYE